MTPLVPYAGFTAAQAAYIRRAQSAWLNVAEGGKRAGKNIINLVAWASVLETHPDRLHLAAGVSQSSAKMNIVDSDGFGLQWLFAGRCRAGQYNGRDALILQTKTGEKAVIIAGGGDSRSASLIKGHSYATAYITEVNECHKTFVQEVVDRTLASSKRQIFFGPQPQAARPLVLFRVSGLSGRAQAQGRNPGYNYGHFTIADNLSIPKDKLIAELGKYDRSSIWFQRDILGRRTSASGRIYTSYDYRDVAVTPQQIREMDFAELSVGIDVAARTPPSPR